MALKFAKCCMLVCLLWAQANNTFAQTAIHEINGRVVLDQNANCVSEASDLPLANWFLDVETGLKHFSVKTDGSGFYRFLVPDGAYEVSLKPLNNNFGVCSAASQSVAFNSSTPQSATFDFVAQRDALCPRLRVEISASNVIPCSTAVIRVHYRNDGTATATNTQLKVQLDPQLSYQSASPKPISVGSDGSLVFNLNQQPIEPGGAWRSVNIQVLVDCAVPPGAYLANDAAISPDQICAQESGWSGAIVVAAGLCIGNEAVFSLTNIGVASTQWLDYIITEDQIVLKTDSFQLDPGEFWLDTVPASGAPLTIIAAQEPGFPGDTVVVFSVINCNGMSEQGVGVGGAPGPFQHQEISLVRESPEENEKSASPPGSGNQHVLRIGSPIEYRVAFQNEGTDTVIEVAIRDTLDPALDAGRVELRGSSHACIWDKKADTVLLFIFSNIQLPPANANPEKSKGWVEFIVYPKAGLAPGTVVENRAGINFDQSDVLLTETVFRTYDSLIIVRTEDLPGLTNLPVQVYPNPFYSEVTFTLPAAFDEGRYRLVITDVSGRVFLDKPFSSGICRLEGPFPANEMFFWQILQDGVVVTGGKMISSGW